MNDLSTRLPQDSFTILYNDMPVRVLPTGRESAFKLVELQVLGMPFIVFIYLTADELERLAF